MLPVQPVVQELARVLRPGGRFAAVVGSTTAPAVTGTAAAPERELWARLSAALRRFWRTRYPQLRTDGRAGDARALTQEGGATCFTAGSASRATSSCASSRSSSRRTRRRAFGESSRTHTSSPCSTRRQRPSATSPHPRGHRTRARAWHAHIRLPSPHAVRPQGMTTRIPLAAAAFRRARGRQGDDTDDSLARSARTASTSRRQPLAPSAIAARAADASSGQVEVATTELRTPLA
jgi:hypothetical protein